MAKTFAIMVTVEDGDVDVTDIDLATYVAMATDWPRKIGTNFEITDMTVFNESALQSLGCQELLDIFQNDPD